MFKCSNFSNPTKTLVDQKSQIHCLHGPLMKWSDRNVYTCTKCLIRVNHLGLHSIVKFS